MKALPEISIKNPVFAWMLMTALILFGAISFNRMGLSRLPDVDFPVINVSANLEGAAPEVMENTVIDVLEGSLTSIEGLKSMTSNSKTGSASVTLEFDINRNIDLALQEVQSKVAQAQRRLPKDLDPPTVSKTNPEDQPIVWLAVTSETMSRRELNVFVRDNIRDQFTTVSGVGDIFLGGYVEPSMRIWANPGKLSSYQMTISDILNTITNEHNEQPSGSAVESGTEWNLRTLGEAKTTRDFENLRINTRGGAPNFSPIPLKSVATVEAGLADVRRLSRVNGVPSIGLGVRKQRGSNAVEVADAVFKKMEVVKKQLPPGVELKVVFDNSTFIRESVHELNKTLVISAILTSILCWLFLGSLSATFNILMAIPTSIVGSFIILYFSGFTLNTFTLLGLSLAIGIVVDDAIMVLENIFRHREMGKDSRTAALDGAKEIFSAAVAASVSIAAIFIPIAFMSGVVGKYFLQFGVTMTAAVFLSLVEAVTLTPMRAATMGGHVAEKEEDQTAFARLMHRLTRKYAGALEVALRHKGKVLVSCLIVFIASLGLSKKLNKEFVPPEDQGRFMVRLLAPVGSSIDYTDGKVKEVEKIVKGIPEISSMFVSVGGFGGGSVNSAVFFVNLKPKNDRKKNQFEVMNEVRQSSAKVKGIRATVQDLSAQSFGSGRGFPVEFAIQGPDWKILEESTEKIQAAMEKSPLFTDVDSDLLKGSPEIQLVPKRDVAALRGVSIQQIGQTVNAFIGGVLAGYYSENGHRYEIRVKVADEGKSPEAILKTLRIRNNRGELIPLSDLVTIERQKVLQQITRRDRTRSLSIYSNVKAGASQEKALEEAERLSSEILPKGYTFRTLGSSQGFRDSMKSLMMALMMGIVIAYMILGSQYNSFKDPVTILLAMPFSISGAFLALWLTKNSINLYSMIGIILLMGIVKKNSILLVEFTNQVRDEGERDPTQALLKACPNRLRPIVMTSISAIVGALPAAFSLGAGSESLAPMAIAVIGGLLLSTLLTLFVVPCFYRLMAKNPGIR
jgi:hydrophobe/amphiphile efflux-1 (HAE1) family protein